MTVVATGDGMGLGLVHRLPPAPFSVGPPSIPCSHYRWVERCPRRRHLLPLLRHRRRGGGGGGEGKGERAGSTACHQSPAKRQWEKANADKTKG